MLNKYKKRLILIDLDGTTLDGDFQTFNKLNKKVLTKLKKEGHVICIATGRNYPSTLPYYQELGLDTFLVTYNGAYIDHPLRKIQQAHNNLEASVKNNDHSEIKRQLPKLEKSIEFNKIFTQEDKQIYNSNENVIEKAKTVLKNLKQQIFGTRAEIKSSVLPTYQEAIATPPAYEASDDLPTYEQANIEGCTPVLANISIANSVVRGILAEKIVQKNLLNVLVDSVDRKIISTSDDIYYREIFFNGNDYIKGDILKILAGKDAFQLVLEFPNEKEEINNILSVLRRNYKASVTFYCGSKLKAREKSEISKKGREAALDIKSVIKENEPDEIRDSTKEKVLVPDESKIVVKIRSVNANKGEAARLLASYYNIALSDTIAFGNDINDIEMMSRVGTGVAVSNSIINLKSHVHDITKLESHHGGVGHYLMDYFNLPSEIKEEEIDHVRHNGHNK